MPSPILSESDPRVQQYLGKTFNRLTAARFVGYDPKGHGQVWDFTCACGGSKTTLIRSVIKGLTGSCGCLHREMLQKRNHVHGYAPRGERLPIYGVWRAMLLRCRDKNYKQFKDYGGRGITVSGEWTSFQCFFDDMGATYKAGLQIDRIDNDKGYCRENCKWSTRIEQARNKRSNHLLTMNGETHPISVWAQRVGGNTDIIYVRLARGWSVERALTTPPIPPSSKHNDTYDFSRT